MDAIERWQEVHTGDPRRVVVEGREVAFATIYHQRMAHWVAALDPSPSDALRLAAWAQHLRRWQLARDAFPTGRAGYDAWRKELQRLAANEAARDLEELGAGAALADRVGALIRKEGLRPKGGADPEPDVATLEDAACLTFLELDFEGFAAKHPRPKMLRILRKTWRKMTPRGHALAVELAGTLAPALRDLVHEAVAAP